MFETHARFGNGWDIQLEAGLPDCRIVNSDIVMHGLMAMEPIFCANCGAHGGLITAGVPHVFYQCDDCAMRLGPIPGVDRVPEAVVSKLRGED